MDEILKVQKHILSVGQTYKTPAFENITFDETVLSISLHIMDMLIAEEKEGEDSIQAEVSNHTSTVVSEAEKDTLAEVVDSTPVKT